MIFVEIHGLWNGETVLDNASVIGLADDLEDQQKQITTLTLQKITAPNPPPTVEPEESAAAFAKRAGFSRLDYFYQQDNTWMIVDVIDPTTHSVTAE
ncbi:MAG TPA: hypothetical protein VLC91_13840 [Spongiibacteraceae bacterium]|nr:hypothetical protein [Spongiibacteraceae bacterium]